ncbi:outer membrane protein RomA [Legionella birminghamensis]|uniref:Outer membrane protein RomA n=1 Tax=Legionella birminghamensis TaxID=28083 RepID=A0A378I6G1_9GAMM|nr:MBL fold metallo-hydrolase [Legionella birminghamensis]KTC70242.1 outer membrane protein RomA [Legionella birminghamensis]STX30350.1 outer membrane protein RomA [Legionella birminghamensis]
MEVILKLLWLIFFCLLSGCQSGFYKGPPSDHFNGKEFYNPGEEHKKRNANYDLFNLWVAILQNQWPESLPKIAYPLLPANYPDGAMVTFINHSTVLIQSKRVNVLIDPIFSYRASPFQWIGPARHREPGLAFDALPTIDVVLVSHNHYDHMDLNTLKSLEKRYHPQFIVPLGNKVILQRQGIKQVSELDWWENVQIKNTRISLLPARHDSRRGLYDLNKTLWGSFGLEIEGRKIYFAGDTGYSPHFKEIKSHWGQPQLSFVPIGAYEPRALAKPYHLNPADAVRAHLDLGSRRSIGIHWGTFQLGAENFTQPVDDLALARKQYGLSAEQFFVIREGIPFYIDK